MAGPMQERLHKYLAHCGIASRRECETLIEEGRVEVNGEVVSRQGVKVDPETDTIAVDGELVKAERKVYYLVNKPRGYLCTNDDERGRDRVVDLVRDDRRIYTVGRLDEDSEGLILLTNDGTLANVVSHPRYQVDKTYKLLIRGTVEPESLRKIEQGVWLSDGKTSPAHIRRLARKGPNTIVTVTLWEGRNRELRRIFAKVGLRVQSLQRTAIGPLRADGLPVGAYRRVEPRELAFAFARLKPGWRPQAKAKAITKKGPKRGDKPSGSAAGRPTMRPTGETKAKPRGRPSPKPSTRPAQARPTQGRRPPNRSAQNRPGRPRG